jgi:hypothetical protein
MARPGTHYSNISWRRLNLVIEDEYVNNGFDNFVLHCDTEGKRRIAIYNDGSNSLQIYNPLDKPKGEVAEQFEELKRIASENDKFPANLPVGIKSQAWSNKPTKRFGVNPKGSSRSWEQYDRAQKTLAHKMDSARHKVKNR